MARRKKRGNAPWRSAFKVFIISVFTIFAGVMLFKGGRNFFKTSKMFSINEIVRDPELQFVQSRHLDSLAGRNIFSINLGVVQKRVQQQYPQVHELRILRCFPDRVLVTAQKRDPFLAVAFPEGDVVVDRDGIVLGLSSTIDCRGPRILGVTDISVYKKGNILKSRQLATAIKIVSGMQNNQYLKQQKIDTIDVQNLSKIRVSLASSIDLLIDRFKTTDQINKLGLLMSQASKDLGGVDYIDLRFKEPIIRKH